MWQVPPFPSHPQLKANNGTLLLLNLDCLQKLLKCKRLNKKNKKTFNTCRKSSLVFENKCLNKRQHILYQTSLKSPELQHSVKQTRQKAGIGFIVKGRISSGR